MEGPNRKVNGFKLIGYSLFGIFMFFASFRIGEKTTIPIDHIVTWVRTIPYAIPVYGGILITLGAILPFINKSWNKTKTTTIFSLLNIVGLIMALMVIFNIGPDIILEPGMAPYVFKVVVVPVIMLVPLGSVFLAFLVDYGLMEFIGVIMKPVMKPIFKTPGRSAVDAVASFVGSYSIALLVTNGVYKNGGYNKREATIIATGFSTVSATFMIILANALGIMEHWSIFFWVTLAVTFIVTAITSRLYPLSSTPETYYEGVEPKLESDEKGNIMKRAWQEGMQTMEQAPSLKENIIRNLKAGIKLGINIGPNIMSIGVISLLVAEYTIVFDIFGYVFYPLTLLLRIPDAMLVAKASAITLADMYVPAIIVKDSGIITRFIVGILCIAELLFLSASIPCILATDIGISIKDIVIIWFWRVVFTLIIATPIVYFIF